MNEAVLNIIIKAVDQATKTMGAVQGGLDTFSKGMDNVAKKSNDLGKKMTTGLTLPIVGVGAASFKTAADFDKTMRMVGAATQAPASSMQKLSDLALKMGADTVFSAGDAANAMLELAKGGITEAQIQAGALSATMTLAAAGQLAMGDAAGYVSNALNTFGLRAEDAGSVAAALAGGANASTASVESLGLALSQVGPGAKLAGLSLQETVAALAAFDNAGVKGSDAGTSLKNMLLRMVPATKEAAEEMKKYGLQFTNADGSFKNLGQVAQQLQDKLGNLSAEQKQATLQTIFGTDAYRAAAILMKEGQAGVESYTKATSDLAAAENMAKVGTGGMSGSIEAMSGSIETAAIKLGTALAPTVTAVANKIGDLADRFANLSPEAQKIIIVVGGIVAALGPGLIIFGKIAGAMSGVAKGVKATISVMKLLSSGVAVAVKAITTSLTFLAAHPVMLAIMAAILVIAGLVYVIIKNWDTIKGWWSSLWQGFMGAVQAFLAWLQPVINVLVTIFTTAFNVILAIVTPIFNAIKFVVQVVFVAIMGIIILQLNIWKALFDGFLAAVTWIWNAIKEPVMAVLGFIVNLIKTYINIWIAIITTIINAAKAIFTAVYNGIKAVITPVAAFFRSIFTTAINAVKSVWNGITGWFGGIISGIGGAFGKVVGIITSPFKSAFNGIASLWNNSIGKLSFKAPDWVPGIGGKGFEMPKLPMLAAGGLVNKPTLAGIGEGGEAEAVVPLSRLERMLELNQTRALRAAGFGTGVGDYANRKTEVTIQNVNLNTAEAVREFYREIDNDTILSSRGLTPVRGGA